ncbi:mitochondrial 54S ribosomal protein YmL9 [Westerdykella ornata]|uniref:Large ribosomal subunit protein uL3m n=1 Tax=Westerdykella ornata TaxID=318751 RepID=A0A6A6J565_WESOR|nr:mitochondrial 54S ribosomal protein YmL9 [Westerdykella ornata]KAF2271327.1 mitochondrial 54S ribosomal protein YmL9 [Westerdykella ornata]
MPPKPPLNWGILPPTFLLPSSTRSLLPQIAASYVPTPALSTSTLPPASYTYTSIRTVMKFKSTQEPRASRFNHLSDKTPPLEATSTAALERKAHSTPLRTGLFGIKRGMSGVYDPETGKRTPCTILQFDRNEVLMHKTRDKHGYWAVQIGAGSKDVGNTTRPMLGHFAVARVGPKRWVGEFKVRGQEGLGVLPGEMIGASWFREGQWVDVQGVSRGMGFAGGMKRHGFGGQPASHGQSLMHRGMGSAGGSQGSGSRVHPGKRMPGRMGNEHVTVKNLKVLQVDEANGIVVVHGCVPGPKNQVVRVQDAIGKPFPTSPMTLAEVVPSSITPPPEGHPAKTVPVPL